MGGFGFSRGQTRAFGGKKFVKIWARVPNDPNTFRAQAFELGKTGKKGPRAKQRMKLKTEPMHAIESAGKSKKIGEAFLVGQQVFVKTGLDKFVLLGDVENHRRALRAAKDNEIHERAKSRREAEESKN